MTRILFLWDAEAFGGHDVTALVALEHLVSFSNLSVGALHTGRNVRLTEELDRIALHSGRLEVICVKASPCMSESFDGLFRGQRTRSLQEAIDRWRPDWAVNVQGFITLGLCALAACRSLHIPVVSYVPMTHRVWTLHPSPISLVQDLFNRFWYSVPTSFITTSNRMKKILIQEHKIPAEHVAIVEYGPDISQPFAGDRATARTQFGFSNSYIVGVVGRVEFGQKRQDFLIRAVARYREALCGYRFIIVGDGPDLSAAVHLVKKLGVGDWIQFMAWQKDPSLLYASLDALLIPSRYEGVPLVMLEAMFYRIPVLASDVDGMADVLPKECLFHSGDAEEMVEKLTSLPGRVTSELLNQLSNLITKRFNAKIFAEHFSQEIFRLIKSDK